MCRSKDRSLNNQTPHYIFYIIILLSCYYINTVFLKISKIFRNQIMPDHILSGSIWFVCPNKYLKKYKYLKI